jgi:hypothetical protein
MMIGKALALVAVMGLAMTPAAAAPRKSKDSGTPAQFQSLMACRAIADAEQRLACFDKETSAMAQAVESKDLVLIDKEKAKATERSLFGFSIPDFGGLFGGGDSEISQIETSVVSSSTNRDGGWTVRLEDGSTWTQIDSTPVPLQPKTGDKVVIKRAAFGSFFMKVGKQPGFRAKRIG